MNALLIDFGSTFTKLRAVALDPVRILDSGQGPSTVTRDVTEGMHAALADLESRMRSISRITGVVEGCQRYEVGRGCALRTI